MMGRAVLITEGVNGSIFQNVARGGNLNVLYQGYFGEVTHVLITHFVQKF
jgi:hypothetical protein